MPNRILRDWTDSENMDSLSVNAERFFVRLIMKVDDFGCYSANTKFLRSTLFPLKTDIRETDIERWIAECKKSSLIALYSVSLKDYLQILNFKQQLRQTIRKYPAMPTQSDCIAIDTPETKLNPETETKPEKPLAIVCPFDNDFFFTWDNWKTYKKKEFRFNYKSTQSEQAALDELIALSGGIQKNAIAIINQSMAKGWRGFFNLKNEDNGATSRNNGETKFDDIFALKG